VVSLTSCTCPKRLQKTNIASELYDFSKYKSHDDYVSNYRENIKKIRPNIESDHLAMLAPFSTTVSNAERCPKKNGVLLLHGLTDSPFTMSNIAKSITNSKYGECAILNIPVLPGHALVPGASLEVTSKHWIDAVDFAIKDLQNRGADDISIIGFSTGGALGLNYVLKTKDENIKLVFVSPALALNISKFDVFLVRLISSIGNHINSLAYLEKYSDINPCKYESFSSTGAKDLIDVIDDNNKMLQTRKSVDNPTFLAISSSDSVISFTGVLNLMSKFSQVSGVVYDIGDVSIPDNFKKINPTLKKERIVDLSHGSLPISPMNSIYGKNAVINYGCLQYEHTDPEKFQSCQRFDPEFYYGSLSKSNRSKYPYLAKILYNPYNESMLNDILNFLQSNPKPNLKINDKSAN